MSEPPLEWVWNDPEIAHESAVYRRIPNRPNFMVPDLDGGPGSPAPGAFKCDPDGISVYRDEPMKVHGISVADLKSRSDDHVFGIRVADVRHAGAGVVDSPDPEDPNIGPAHASIRYPQENVTKPVERGIRLKMIEACWPAE